MLRCYVEKNDEWETYLPLVLFAYCTTNHVSTGVSPFEVMYGRSPAQLTNYKTQIDHDITSYQRFFKSETCQNS